MWENVLLKTDMPDYFTIVNHEKNTRNHACLFRLPDDDFLAYSNWIHKEIILFHGSKSIQWLASWYTENGKPSKLLKVLVEHFNMCITVHAWKTIETFFLKLLEDYFILLEDWRYINLNNYTRYFQSLMHVAHYFTQIF
jgi:hypothetical protein